MYVGKIERENLFFDRTSFYGHPNVGSIKLNYYWSILLGVPFKF